MTSTHLTEPSTSSSTVDQTERQPLAELREILRKKPMTIRRTEWHGKRGKERPKKRTSFIVNPYRSSRKLLGDKWSGHLECSVDVVNTFLCNILSNPAREQKLAHNKALISPVPPTTEFYIKEPSWREVQEVVQAACCPFA